MISEETKYQKFETELRTLIQMEVTLTEPIALVYLFNGLDGLDQGFFKLPLRDNSEEKERENCYCDMYSNTRVTAVYKEYEMECSWRILFKPTWHCTRMLGIDITPTLSKVCSE